MLYTILLFFWLKVILAHCFLLTFVSLRMYIRHFYEWFIYLLVYVLVIENILNFWGHLTLN
jgi:hypothetical protein